jgi:hypothetical protein
MRYISDLPEPHAIPAGYAALIAMYDLSVPRPHKLTAIGEKHKKYETLTWKVLTPRHAPENTLEKHLIFAIKYEGIDLAILNQLFKKTPISDIESTIKSSPQSGYMRRIWFLYEYLQNTKLDIPNAKKGEFIPILDDTVYYTAEGIPAPRYRVYNNLPGTKNFCPLIRRTPTLDAFVDEELSTLLRKNIGTVHPDVLLRAAAFLLLEDSKASYAIEGEAPPHNRAERWGYILGKAGQSPLSKELLVQRQADVIPDARFTQMGYRRTGGFIGTHDRDTKRPIPEHISAQASDLDTLMNGLIETAERLKKSNYPPVLSAAAIAFGFVFIHPFEDGNGRIHRYLLHHVLAETGFTPPGIVFPVSSVILENISAYRRVLEAYAKPRLSLIEWRETEKGNIEVCNETLDLYRYFDATEQAEFLYSCVMKTIHTTLPNEVAYLQKYDHMKLFIKQYIDMPDRLVDLLIQFLNQNKGKLSQRARTKEFEKLTDTEVQVLEDKFKEIFEQTNTPNLS